MILKISKTLHHILIRISYQQKKLISLPSKHFSFDSYKVSKMYIAQAQRLEEQGRFKEAEKLYISVQEPDLSISMYKKQRQYDQVIEIGPFLFIKCVVYSK